MLALEDNPIVSSASSVIDGFLPGRGISLSQLFRAIELPLSADQFLELLIQLRLHDQVENAHELDLSRDGAAILEFISLSLAKRRSAAIDMCREVISVDERLAPYKFAFALKYLEFVPARYYRDLDFAVDRTLARSAIDHLIKAGFFPGDIDPNDWSRFLMTETASLDAVVRNNRELHMVVVRKINEPRLQSLYSRVSKIAHRLNELQFYGFIRGQFTSRLFIDIAFVDRGFVATCYSDPVVQYLAQLAQFAYMDIRSGRIGLNQVLEIQRLTQSIQNQDMQLPKELKQLIDDYGEPWLPKGKVRIALEAFVCQKIAAISPSPR